MQISVVIPTCNRKARLLSLLKNLNQSLHPIHEVIIVDSGNDILANKEYSQFTNLPVRYLQTEPSVCIQRNSGIKNACSPWIFLCDDDVELPSDYLQKLSAHIEAFPGTGAVSGLWLQREKNLWKATYPENSAIGLCWKYIFQLGMWGEIGCTANNAVIKKIRKYYRGKGNHISKAGWPVLTNFSGEYFTTPVYSLGASLVKREWLLNSPFDEVLDRHGIGDNYGVIRDFPGANIHVLTTAVVYHHQEALNRLQRSLQYYRRALALGYFIKTKDRLKKTKKIWLIWSLTGNLLQFLFSDRAMIRAAVKSIWVTAAGKNPYYKAAKKGQKLIEPLL